MKFVFLLFFASCLYATPKANLSATGLYSDIATKKIAADNKPFSPQYPLWTDGALKKRWIYLPKGKQIDTSDEDHWQFPVGTKIWKEFAFENAETHAARLVETRLIEKISDEEWDYASYLWNQDATEAVLAPEDGIKDYTPINETVKHDIPSVTECQRCHRRGGDPVMGFDALQLSTDRDPNAPHKEKLEFDMVTLKSLIDEKLLTNVTPNIQDGNPKIHSATKEGRAILGYMHANCANCHNPQGSSKHISLNLRHVLNAKFENDTPAFKTTMNKATQVFSMPNVPKSFRILAGKPEMSAMVYMMENFGASHMPPLGTKIPDEKAIQLLSYWIMYFGD